MKIKDEDKILKQFETDWESMDGEWGHLHTAHRHDIKFTWFNEQWNQHAREDREGPDGRGYDGAPPRPCLTFNIIKAYIVKVCNGIKKLRMSIKVAPVDGDTDKELAQVNRGIQRSIERNTGAAQARDHATNQAVTAGYGFYAFKTDFEDPRSFEQELKYRIIHDATDVLWDDGDMTLDGSGVKKVQYRETITKDEFKIRYKKDWDEVGGGDKLSRAWGSEEKPVVTEYWYIEEVPEKLVLVKGDEGQKSQPMFLSEVEKAIKEKGIEATPEDFLEIGEDGEYVSRDSHSRRVWCCKLAGRKVLTKDLWPGYWIPWFKVEGRLGICDGDIIRSGLSRDGEASQECYNYARNSAIERLGLSTKLSWITATGSIPKTEQPKWNTSNSRNWPKLEYDAINLETQTPNPPPMRTPPADIDVGHVQEAQTSQNELKSVFGMYGSFMGNTQNEKSGKAIEAGARESADSVYDFADNKVATMKHEGRVRGEVIPKIYDTPRQVRMVGEDDIEKVVTVNERARDEKGKDYYYDLKQGKYDYTIEMGPSEDDKRSETRAGMESLRSFIPPVAFMAMADIYVGEENFHKSDEMAARLKNWININMPGVIEDKDGPSPEVQQIMQQLEQMKQESGQIIQGQQQKIQELESKQAIELAKLKEQSRANEEKNEVAIYEAEIKGQEAETNKFEAETDRIDKLDKNQIEKVKTVSTISKENNNGVL